LLVRTLARYEISGDPKFACISVVNRIFTVSWFEYLEFMR